MPSFRILSAFILLIVPVLAQTEDPKQRIKAIRELGRSGSGAIPQLEANLNDPSPAIRLESVKAIVEIGTAASLPPLTAATHDNDPDIQIRAVAGLVNFYSPGYVGPTGITGSVKRAGTALRSKFTDTNDRVIEPYIQVRPEIIDALGKLVRGGASMESRANAARALGVLRGRAAVDDLVAALRSKSTQVMHECLVALEKIRDESAGPKIIYLSHDLDEGVQVAAIEALGLLRTREAIPDLTDVLNHAKSAKVRRAALSALAMLPDPANRDVYARYLEDKDDGLRAAAAEGFARLKNAAELPLIEKNFNAESKMNPRLSLAFAAVALGRNDLGELSPLRYLVNTLNSNAYRGVAQPFLTELARDPGVRRTLYTSVNGATRDEKIYLGQVLAATGDQDTVKYLDALAHDPDSAVAQEGLKSLKNLKARL